MQQKETSSNVRVRTKLEIKEPKKHRVVIFDDDVTPLEFVLVVLKVVFFLDMASARAIADKAMQDGNAVVGKYAIDIARSKVAKATDMSRSLGFPLKFEIENTEDE